MPEVEIIRTEVFVVDHSESDEHGNLSVVDKDRVSHKVNKKHESIHSVFTDGMAVEVGYGTFKGFEFIHTARQVKDGIGEIKTASEALVKPATAPESKTFKTDGKNRSFALAYAKDWCIAQNVLGKELKVTDVISCAVLFESYLENGATVKKNVVPKSTEPEDIPY